MQDEVNEKTIALYIKTGKLTAQTLQKAMKAILSKGKKQLAKPPQGKQSLKQLMKQNAGVSNIEITKDNAEDILKEEVGQVFAKVLEDMEARDARDANRAAAPMKPADDAVIFDTSALNIAEVAVKAEEIIEAKLKKTL